jgi:DNA-binding LacI/PurR family transcriptional regulator
VVTIRDVAKHAGVSPATVSRVVNGLVGYSDETRERVEDAVRKLSYETDYLARGFKTRQTSVIGLLAPMVPDALASQVMQGVEEEAQERGYAVMLGRTGAKSAFIASYLRTLRTYRAAGVILISAVITPETQLLGPNIPIISVAISDKSGSPSWLSTTSRQPTTRPATCCGSAPGASASSPAIRRRSTSPSPASAATIAS